MKVLSIGNSFSQDAHKYLHKLAASNGLDINTVNLYIGGCTLEQHWQNITADRAEYDLEYDGGEAFGKISIQHSIDLAFPEFYMGLVVSLAMVIDYFVIDERISDG